MPREGEPRAEKVAVVEEVKTRFSSSSAALLTEFRGLKVGELAELRRALRKAGGDYKIYKNTLVRFAVRDLGLAIDAETLTGPTAIAFVEGDAAAVAKALRDYARTNANLVLKGGLLGSKALTVEETRALAELPSREVLLAQLAGALQAPMAKLAGLLQALPRNMAYGLKALIDQRVEGGEAAPEAVAADAEAPAADETPGTEEAPAEADVSENEAVVGEAASEETPAAAAEPDPEAPVADAEAPAEGAPAAEAETDAPAEAEVTESSESTETPAEAEVTEEAPTPEAPAAEAESAEAESAESTETPAEPEASAENTIEESE